MLGGLTLLAANQARAAVGRQARAFAFYAAAALAAVLGLVFALVGLHVWLSSLYGDITASAIIAGTLFVIAGVIAFAGHRVRTRRSEPSPALASTALVAAPIAARLFRGSALGTAALVSVVVLGAVLGRQLAKD